jgi:hypothetical protein
MWSIAFLYTQFALSSAKSLVIGEPKPMSKAGNQLAPWAHWDLKEWRQMSYEYLFGGYFAKNKRM